MVYRRTSPAHVLRYGPSTSSVPTQDEREFYRGIYMPRETPSPIDLPAEPLGRPGLLWATGTIVIAALILLAANAVALRDWIDEQPPSPVQEQAAALADQWVTITDAAGVGRPREWLHDLWKKAENARFGV